MSFNVNHNEQFQEIKKLKKIHRCGRCQKEFRLSYNYQVYCSEKCSEAGSISEDKKYIRSCKNCRKPFRKVSADSQVTVCYPCKREYSRGYKRAQKKCPIELWVKEKKERHGISLAELIRRQEWKRVYGKGAWDHYLKGRKWNKI